jgi:demethylmenaquinone methyltransferase/2-methoxy-6-polyprenyl-1,4-benzoquinol methylase
MALQARRRGAARVIGVDFARAMLEVGQAKVCRAAEGARITLLQGDAACLPVRSASVDALTIAFGIRNVQQPSLVCGEMARALKPGGRVAILEFGVPRVPGIATLYLWYFKYVLPLVGRVVSGHDAAYSYLPASVSSFPPPDEFCGMLRAAGFEDVVTNSLTFGIVYLYTARRA